MLLDYNATGGDNAMVIDGSNNVGIGTTNPSYKLDVSGTGRFTGQLNGNLGVNVGANALGADRMFQVSGTAFTSGTTQFGVVVNPSFSGTITNVFGVYAGNNFGTGTITNSYNLYIEGTSLGSATVTNRWGLYQAGGSDKNYFAGSVGIGTTSPAYKLDVSGSSMTRGTLVIDNNGTDTSLTEYIRFERNSQGSANYFNSIYSSTGSGSNFMQFRLSNTSGSQGTVMTLTGTGNVGIGTTSPTQKLSVAGSYVRMESLSTDNTNAGTFYRVLNGATIVGQSTQCVLNNGDYIITTGTSSEAERMRITSGGNVLIGDTSNASGSPTFYVKNKAGAVANIAGWNFGGTTTAENGNNNLLTSGAYYNGSSMVATQTTSTGYQQYSGIHVFYTNSGLTPGNAYSNTERMRITNDGQVGIGTATPSIYGLTFANQFTVSNTTTYGNITVAGSSGNSGGIDFGSQTVRHAGVYGIPGSALGFYTNSTNTGNGLSERMKISSGGVFTFNGASASYTYNFANGSMWIDGGQGAGVGSDYTSWNTITFNDQFSNTSKGPNKIITYGRGSTWVAGIGIHDDTQAYYAGGTHKFYKFNGTTATLNLSLDGSGNLTSTGSMTATSFFESSDSRLKTIIEDNYQVKGIENVVAKLYTKNGKTELGYFAQDVESLLDNAITRGEDGYLNLSYREVHTAKIASLEARVKDLEEQLKQK